MTDNSGNHARSGHRTNLDRCIPVNLIDTAGLRESSDEAESIGIQKTREALADADLVLIVLDATAKSFVHEEQLIRD